MEPGFAQLTADNADQLGGYRIGELTGALAALSNPAGPVLRPRFLGGAGRWRAGASEMRAVAAQLEHPNVVRTYDVVASAGRIARLPRPSSPRWARLNRASESPRSG